MKIQKYEDFGVDENQTEVEGDGIKVSYDEGSDTVTLSKKKSHNTWDVIHLSKDEAIKLRGMIGTVFNL